MGCTQMKTGSFARLRAKECNEIAEHMAHVCPNCTHSLTLKVEGQCMQRSHLLQCSKGNCTHVSCFIAK